MRDHPTDRPSQAFQKAARALLGWGLEDLCERTGLCKAVVHGFETGRVASTSETRERIMGAYASAGITFQAEGVIVDQERARQYERNYRRRVARQEAA